MNISNLFNFSTSNNWSNTGSSGSSAKSVDNLSPLALAVQRADKRVQTEVDSNTAQLSSFGKLKSLVSEVQIAANSLRNLPAAASSTDIQVALAALVSAFNQATNAATSTAALPGAPGASQSANRVGKDLQKAISTDASSTDALKKLGLNLHNGTLTLNEQTLEKAHAEDPAGAQNAFTALGEVLDHVASQELKANGNVSDSLNTLSQIAKVLDAQQSALQSAAQATSTSQSRPATGAFGFGVAAYQSQMKRG